MKKESHQKSKPMMNLVSRCSERTPAVLASTASESPGKTRDESQTPLSPQTEKCDRRERPVVNAQHTDRFMIENDEMNSYALGSRSLLHRVNDQVRKRQKQSSKDATKDSEKHSGKNYSDNWHSIKNTEDLKMKQMFDISEKLIVGRSDEIYGVKTIIWDDSSWKLLSLVGDEQVISLLHTKVVVTLRHTSILVQGAGESRDVGCVTNVEKLTLRRNFLPTLLPFLSRPRRMLSHDPVVSKLIFYYRGIHGLVSMS